MATEPTPTTVEKLVEVLNLHVHGHGDAFLDRDYAEVTIQAFVEKKVAEALGSWVDWPSGKGMDWRQAPRFRVLVGTSFIEGDWVDMRPMVNIYGKNINRSALTALGCPMQVWEPVAPSLPTPTEAKQS